ncbi:hypothetical protein H113_02918 [Trichophyton rubrum MR1459]|nr:hypothetical protein H113_02918 [Trichophyton rubrum MR1459]
MDTLELQGEEKLIEVSHLLKTLRSDLDQKALQTSQLIETLQKLRVHGRKPENADPIYEKEVRKQMVLGAHVTALTDYL